MCLDGNERGSKAAAVFQKIEPFLLPTHTHTHTPTLHAHAHTYTRTRTPARSPRTRTIYFHYCSSYQPDIRIISQYVHIVIAKSPFLMVQFPFFHGDNSNPPGSSEGNRGESTSMETPYSMGPQVPNIDNKINWKPL